ncbi:thioesterase family protein [Hahella aquimaris]|uniref:acyl-CoA thioesterase n=1 Tax=Hahella sp. HNIBRBA332 TaxID=3015983 RepID=UPI00273BE6DE|nr:thioesterase family protein [Hahella sp. HNIBRBA332]WLQ12920.1 thioesterase family protein [Hahella sp. HNIBRBA332]
MTYVDAISWDMLNPFIMPIKVLEPHTDRLGHTNNTTYLNWMEEVSWRHIDPLGMSWAAHEKLGKAMAITRTEVDYLAASHADDELFIGTWITACDGRLQSSRHFQIFRPADGKTIVRANSYYACIDMKSGKPTRMPKEFVDAHRKAMEAHGLTPASD